MTKTNNNWKIAIKNFFHFKSINYQLVVKERAKYDELVKIIKSTLKSYSEEMDGVIGFISDDEADEIFEKKLQVDKKFGL